jgi:hypothetical protein
MYIYVFMSIHIYVKDVRHIHVSTTIMYTQDKCIHIYTYINDVKIYDE